MDLPLVDEIREARRLAEEASDASLHVNRAQAVLSSINLLEHQLKDKPDLDAPIPGDGLIEDLVERWQELSDLPSEGPRPSQSIQERLRLRRRQIQGALVVLSAVAGTATARSNELHQLQHKQSKMLEDPKYGEEVVKLATLSQQRDRIGNQFHPLNARYGAIGPTRNVISAFVTRIEDAGRQTGAAPGLDAWRGATVAANLLIAVERVLSEANLEVPTPAGIDVPPAADPADAERLTAEVERVKHDLRKLVEGLAEERQRLEVRVHELKQRYDELTRAITDLMG